VLPVTSTRSTSTHNLLSAMIDSILLNGSFDIDRHVVWRSRHRT
jgi:hypothetical protein